MKSCESKSANIQPSIPTLAAAINFFPNRRVCSLTASWQRVQEKRVSRKGFAGSVLGLSQRN